MSVHLNPSYAFEIYFPENGAIAADTVDARIAFPDGGYLQLPISYRGSAWYS